MAVVAAVIIVVNCLAMSPTFYSIITMALGGAKYENVGGGDVDAEYYKSSYASHDEAIAATEEKIIPEAVTEGIVLLENNEELLPLSEGAKVSLFGYDSINLVVGGTGSGQSVGKADMKTALESDGFDVNDDVWTASTNGGGYRGSVDVVLNTADFRLTEISSSAYDGAKSTYSNYDTAIYMIGRMGGEAFDLPRDMGEWRGDSGRHYLEMTSGEEALLSYICDNFTKVVVIVNTAGNSFEMDRVNAILDDAKAGNSAFKSATLFMAGVGSTGANGVGEVLNGTVSPSGHMTDTWLWDMTKDITYANSGDFRYGGLDNVAYVEYEEGIYMGYRYYETIDAIKDDGGEWYSSTVSYPFGYGLSYTTFSQTMSDITVEDGALKFDVTVTNTGNTYSGKDVVQIYQTAPYYTGGIEKAERVLVDFAKTDNIEPGGSRTVSFSIPVEDLASYDYKTEKAYVLDGGEYTIIAGKNAHEAYDSKTVELEKVVYSGDNKRSSDAVAATNKFDDMSEYMEKATTQLTRADNFAGGVTAPSGSGDDLPSYQSEYLTMSLSEALTSKDPSVDYTYDPSVYSGGEPVFGEANGLDLIELRGLEYDDPLWEDLLDQMDMTEVRRMIGTGGYQTLGVDSINKPATKDPDGPAGFTSFMDASIYGSSIPAATLIACTWNKDLAEDLGEAIGEEGLTGGYSGWYAPATNMHRYPLSGRHFEYYSEDPVLAGHMTTQIVQGAASKGVYAYVKHFAINEQETNRKTNNNVATWANEQAVREIYLKPFEMCVKNATIQLNYLASETDEDGLTTYTMHTKQFPACTAIMSSYNRVGAIWAGGRYSLMTGVLRDEWGFDGMVVTDYFSTSVQDMNQMLRAGNDLALTTIASSVPVTTAEDKTVLRNAAHNIFYTVVNSNAMNGFFKGTSQVALTPAWVIVLYTVTGILSAAWVAWGVILILDGTGKTHIVYQLTNEEVKKVKKDKNKQ